MMGDIFVWSLVSRDSISPMRRRFHHADTHIDDHGRNTNAHIGIRSEEDSLRNRHRIGRYASCLSSDCCRP